MSYRTEHDLFLDMSYTFLTNMKEIGMNELDTDAEAP